MFQIANNLFPSAFYIAADDWTRKDGEKWGIDKRYGAFCSAVEFVTDFWKYLEIAVSTRSSAKIVSARRIWMTAQEGQTICDEVIWEWRQHINNHCPKITEQCAHSLGYMILRGSRLTGDGQKISYHITFSWLIFQCNTTMLCDVVGSMSVLLDMASLLDTFLGVPLRNRNFSKSCEATTRNHF